MKQLLSQEYGLQNGDLPRIADTETMSCQRKMTAAALLYPGLHPT